MYLQYEVYKRKYYEAQTRYDEILNEKMILFERTQPGGVSYEKERVNGGEQSNKFDSYLIAKEQKQIDERLNEAKTILDDRERLLRQKEKELRDSKVITDKVYVLRYIERQRIYKIANVCHYSEAQIYRILRDISDSLNHDRK